MRLNKVKQLWSEGKPATMGWLSIANTFSAELMARAGFDSLCIDLQHGTMDMGMVLPMLQAVSQTDTTPIVRVPWNDAAPIMKALDLGAYGVIVPMINTAADAAKAVAACRFMPTGMRSAGPVRALQVHGPDYFTKSDSETLVLGMIETQDGLKNLDAIAATPGLDALYIGPADLSYALGLPPKADNMDPLHFETCNKILEAAHRHGKKACMHCATGTFAVGAIERGFDLVMLTSDFHSMMQGARKHLDDLKSGLSGKKVEAKAASASGY